MENIYRTWTEYNKQQSKDLKGPLAAAALKRAEQTAQVWKTSSYPRGEDWKYVKFNDLPTTHLQRPQEGATNQQVADDRFYTLEVKNFHSGGGFEKLALPEGVEVVSETERGEVPVVETQTTNPFELLGPSFFGLGFYIRVQPHFKGEKPLRLVFDLDGLSGKDLFVQQNIHIEMEPGARAEIFVESRGQSFSGLCNLCFKVQCERQSQLKFFNKESGGPQSFFVFNLTADVMAEAEFRSFDLTLPSQWSRHNISVDLKEEKALGELRGVYLNNQKRFVDHHTTIKHSVGNTDSFEDYRGILAGEAQAVFNGKIYIAKKASQSNSEQINKNLMLSKKAEVDTKPELQIYNDDVKAAHGATVGQIDEEQRFYLQSRGYSEKEAGRVLAKAFIYGLLEPDSALAQQFVFSSVSPLLAELEEADL